MAIERHAEPTGTLEAVAKCGYFFRRTHARQKHGPVIV
jgi:hypothetical protein